MQCPVFIFSLPRSGSTLLQRILASHSQIASTAEPWILLPLVYAAKKKGTLAEYNHKLSVQAIHDFVNNLPQGQKDYHASLRQFAFDLYEKQCRNNERYFLDKTPRYHNIIDEIDALFPESKSIFLFRNPMQMFASVISYRCRNRLYGLFNNYQDLFQGPANLVNAYQRMQSKSLLVDYDELINKPELTVKKILDYLDLEYDPALVEQFHDQQLAGSMGDRVGSQEYKHIDTAPLNKWKKVFATVLRKKLLKRYISGLDGKILSCMGYDKEEMLKQVDSIESKWRHTCRDSIDLLCAFLVFKLKLSLFVDRNRRWVKDVYIS